jgi:hypothetical protein
MKGNVVDLDEGNNFAQSGDVRGGLLYLEKHGKASQKSTGVAPLPYFVWHFSE